MVFVKFTGGDCYCECDFEEYMKFDHDVDEDFLDGCLDDLVADNAQAFEHVVTGWDGDWESEEEEERYYEDCSGSWKIITEEEYLENGGQ